MEGCKPRTRQIKWLKRLRKLGEQNNLGNGSMQTRIGNSTVTTHADGTVVKQFESGLTQRHIPMNSGGYVVTERAPNGTLTMTLPDGTRMLESPTGRLYTFEPNGAYEVQRQTGLRLNVSPDGSKIFTHQNGVMTKFDTAGKERTFSKQNRGS